MPISATGADRRSEAGFTLVELMVVVMIIGLAASVVVMTAPGGQARLMKDADAFGARLVAAKEEAVLTNRPVGVVVGPQGYSFRVRNEGRWGELKDGPFKPVNWSQGVVASAAEPVQVTFEATGIAEPLAVTLTREARRVEVSVDAAGNVKVGA